MKVLATADWHVGNGYEHRRDALADTAKVLDQIVDIAVERGVGLVVHAGDLFHRTKPAPAEYHVAKRFFDKLERRGRPIPSVLLHGNGSHSANLGEDSAEELFGGGYVQVSRRPELFEYPGVTVCTLPAVPLGRLVAAGSTDRAEVSEQAVDLLLQAARDLRAQAPTDRPAVLLAHWAISGNTLPTGLPVEQLGEVVLPLWEVEQLGFDACFFGHIHSTAVLGDKARVISLGSPMTCDFGEANSQHGCWIWEPGHLAEFVPLQDRRFVDIEVDLTDDEERRLLEPRDETDWIHSEFMAPLTGPLEGAVVKVRYQASEEQHRRVDQQALLRLLDGAGVHRVFGGVTWIPVREQQVRAAGMDETLAPMEALALWLDAQGVNGADGAALRILAKGYLEEQA